MNYTVRDFDPGFSPWNLNNHGDVVGHSRTESAPPSVHFRDGTVVALPSEMLFALDISDDGLVLGRLESMEPVFFAPASSAIDPIGIPGFPEIHDLAITD